MAIHNSASVKKPAKPGRPPKGTMRFFLSKRPKEIRNLGLALKDELEKLHLKCHIPKSHYCANFKLDSTLVCVVRARNNMLRLTYKSKNMTPPTVSGFVYRARNGDYVSEIKTGDDIGKTVSVIRDIWRIKKTPNAAGATALKHTFFIQNKQFGATSSIDVLRQIVEQLAQEDPAFIQRLPESKKYFISKASFPYSYKIKNIPGWWLNQNMSLVRIKKAATMIRGATTPSIRDTMSGDIFNMPEFDKPVTTEKPNAKIEFQIEGIEFQSDSAIGAIKKIIAYLSRVDNLLLTKIENMNAGKKRKHVSKDKHTLYRGQDDVDKFVYEIPTAPGWYMGTNLNVIGIKKLAALAKEAVDPKIRNTMTGSIFELYPTTPVMPTTDNGDTKDGEHITGGDYTIPKPKNMKNKFTNTSGDVRKPAKPGRPPKGTMRFFLSKRPKEIRNLGLALKDELEKLHLKCHIPKSNYCANFKLDSTLVCVVRARTNMLRLTYKSKNMAPPAVSGFVYRARNGDYVSEIKTDDDIGKTVSVIRDIWRIKKTPNAAGAAALKHTFFIQNKQFGATSSIDALRQIVEQLAQEDPAFIQRLPESKKHFISQASFPYSYKIKNMPGWWLNQDMNLVRIKKAATRIREATTPSIRDTMSGDIFNMPEFDKPATTEKPNAKFEFQIEGMKFQSDSAIGALKHIVNHLADADKQFLQKIVSMDPGKKRKYISQDKHVLYGGQDDVDKFVYEIPNAPGWYLGTNFTILSLKKLAALAKEAVDPKIRNTMTGSIFELYPINPAKPPAVGSNTDSYELITDEGYVLPKSENVENEFKASFVHDYKAAEFGKHGNKKAKSNQENIVKKTNFGFGLEWDIAKAIAGFSNSYIEEGRLWVGIKEENGRPVALGLEHDFARSKAKQWDDDFKTWINDKLGNCIRDYNKFTDNIQLLTQHVSGKRICLFIIKKAQSPMFLVNKNNHNDTKFYRRSGTAPQTNILGAAELLSYMKKRFP